jgi:hypothetical protein
MVTAVMVELDDVGFAFLGVSEGTSLHLLRPQHKITASLPFYKIFDVKYNFNIHKNSLYFQRTTLYSDFYLEYSIALTRTAMR